MQEALHLVHAHNDSECNRPEGWEQEEAENKCHWDCFTFSEVDSHSTFVDTEIVLNDQVEEHFRKLSVSKRKSPKSEVGSSVGNGSKDELNGLNKLMDKCFTK
jgi:hypothetical protein